MSAPEKIAIATEGYRCPEFEPEKVAIATHGYRCEADVPVIDPSQLGGGHGKAIVFPTKREEEREREDVVLLALVAALAIEEVYADEI